MPLTYICVPNDKLGNLKFIGHAETITKSVQNGNRRERVPEKEVYLLNSDLLGTITVTVPSENAVKGSFFKKEVLLDDLRVVSEVFTRVNSVTGAVDVRTKEILHANTISVKGAVK